MWAIVVACLGHRPLISSLTLTNAPSSFHRSHKFIIVPPIAFENTSSYLKWVRFKEMRLPRPSMFTTASATPLQTDSSHPAKQGYQAILKLSEPPAGEVSDSQGSVIFRQTDATHRTLCPRFECTSRIPCKATWSWLREVDYPHNEGPHSPVSHDQVQIGPISGSDPLPIAEHCHSVNRFSYHPSFHQNQFCRHHPLFCFE